jgi:hypothetical protein
MFGASKLTLCSISAFHFGLSYSFDRRACPFLPRDRSCACRTSAHLSAGWHLSRLRIRQTGLIFWRFQKAPKIPQTQALVGRSKMM